MSAASDFIKPVVDLVSGRWRRRKNDFLDVFATPQGERVLGYLATLCFSQVPTFEPGMRGIDHAFHEGKRYVWLEINRIMKLSEPEIEILIQQETVEE